MTFYNSMYYNRTENRCYVVRGGAKNKRLEFDGLNESDIIDEACRIEEYECTGDLCMGRGLVGLAAHRHGRRFVGTELNPKRLSVLVETLAAAGLGYCVTMDEEET